MIKTIKDLKTNLDSLLIKNDIVFICPHIGPDADAIASAIGLYMIATKMKKQAFIVINDERYSIERAVKTIIDELPDTVKIINLDKALKIMEGKKVLLTTVDTNKSNMVPFDNFKAFNDIVVIDHHDVDSLTIDTDYLFVDTKQSSASEIMFQLMNMYNIKMDYRLDIDNVTDPVNISTYLLSGINLDTSKFLKNTSPQTMTIVSKLMKKGADLNFVNNLFIDDFESDMRIQNLVSKTAWRLFNIGIAINNDDPDMVYTKEELAKAADWLLKYKATDASFAIGYLTPPTEEKLAVVGVSARSKGVVDVGEIMRQLNGGGNEFAGAAQINTNDLLEVKLKLERVIRPGYRLINESDSK